MDRRDLLLESSEGEQITPEEETRLRKAAEIGGMYLGLTSHAGWKHAMSEYISKQISQDKYLTAKTEDLADVRAAQKALIDFLHFIKSNIDAGEKAYKRLQKETVK
jgi:putative NIF3 family GTP cyclohydrolase 1 type 2